MNLKFSGGGSIEIMEEQLLRLVSYCKEDESKIEDYLQGNNMSNFFKEYQNLDLTEGTVEQIKSLKIIIDSYENI